MVRESQEVVEICLKALLRHVRIEVPRLHDVSPVLEDNRDRLPAAALTQLERLSEVSRSLRRDRELAFYGSEDLTPSTFYRREDAEKALRDATFVHRHRARSGAGTGEIALSLRPALLYPGWLLRGVDP